jgi:glycosyltransferase involved in cell wall biosynthesis
MAVNAGALAGASALIEHAEELFAAGEVRAARMLLADALADTTATADDRAQALSDLGVIATLQGDLDGAEAHLLNAVAHSPESSAALENLCALSSRNGDLVQATHWAQRAAQAGPGSGAAWLTLGELLLGRRRWEEADRALRQAAHLGQDVEAQLRDIAVRRGDPAAVPAGPHRPHELTRVLIVVDYFHPSLGGSERLAETAGIALQELGVEVDIATRPLPQRTTARYRGMTIHEIAGDPVARMSELLRSGYDAALIFSAPTSWPLIASLRVPPPRARLVAVPCINAENDAALRSSGALLHEYTALLSTADVVVHSSRSGPDVRLCEDLGLAGVYVPNATERAATAARSPTAELAGDAPLLLMVANMWPEKNHVGMLRALGDHRGDFVLAIVGDASPAHPEIAAEVRALTAADPRVHLMGRLEPGEVAAAMTDADLLLLPSLAEAAPLVLLEAMSRRLPWIATPACGAAHDHAGGLILPLRLFGEGIEFLLGDGDAATRLGAAGCAHWESSYTWGVIGPRYAQLLAGRPVGALPAPADAVAATDEVRRRFYDGRTAAAARRDLNKAPA